MIKYLVVNEKNDGTRMESIVEADSPEQAMLLDFHNEDVAKNNEEEFVSTVGIFEVSCVNLIEDMLREQRHSSNQQNDMAKINATGRASKGEQYEDNVVNGGNLSSNEFFFRDKTLNANHSEPTHSYLFDLLITCLECPWKIRGPIDKEFYELLKLYQQYNVPMINIVGNRIQELKDINEEPGKSKKVVFEKIKILEKLIRILKNFN
ncbi:hypothetical protein [Carnobacterium maltaromaticum]|uniref:hypothetical protein n=1 Tax=Carnobacterium maltaromaticum TaxID=2751 RepID=UPI0012FA75DB|nr:hypothetical protein [Carnobacterium maltaromaticum]